LQKKADEIKAVSLQSAIDTCEKLEIKLTEFAKTHRNDIRNDPVFRQRFLEMCAPLGVDPLSSDKSFWGSVLGMGDFYHELAVKVAEVCSASRSTNGGIMSVKEVQAILAKRKTRLGTASAAATVSASDIEVAIKKLGKLGGGFRTIKVGKSTMIVSVPNELDGDIMRVMAVGNEISHGITVDDMIVATQWSRERVERAVQLLLQEGMAWLDTHQGDDYYWFPSSWQEERAKIKEQDT
jgi:ESCRT-II complex subunit VPS22